MSKADSRVIPLKEKPNAFLHNYQGVMLCGFLGAMLILNTVFASAVMAEGQTPTREMSETVEILCPKLAAINRENPLPADSEGSSGPLRGGENQHRFRAGL